MQTEKHRTRPASSSAIERYAVLALRRDVSLGVLLSTNARDFLVMLAGAAQPFPAGREFSEREVNDLLRNFLAGSGSMLATDHVELRRWLVDFRVLARDGYGRVYTAGTPAAEISALIDELAGIDLATVARAAREREAARRVERKERWENAKRGVDV
jgi:hypothetical protein